MKAFLTSTEDKYRPPFGRTPVTVKRSGVIVGTTNDQDFLHDPSGSRRFWVVPVGAIDTTLLRAQRDQLLAEAVVAHVAGESTTEGWAAQRPAPPFARRFVLAPGERAQQHEHDDDDQDDQQNAHGNVASRSVMW